MLALFDGEDGDEPRTVHLVLWAEETEHTFEREMRIHMVCRLRHDQQWALIGELDAPPLVGTIKTNWNLKVAVKGVFSTRDRHGYLETIE